MAKIVLGMGSSHGPLLRMLPEHWGIRADAERRNPAHYYKNKVWTYDQLEKERAGEHLEREITEEVKKMRYDACQKAIETLAQVYDEVKPDVVVIVGDDQKELFREAIPPFSVHWGETIENGPMGAHGGGETTGKGVVSNNWPDEPAVYPGHPELGLHIIKTLRGDNFDVSSVKELPPRPTGEKVVPHAYGFVYRRIMKDKVVPNVPVIINTFYPPNQPTVQRCIGFGKSLHKAIESWDSDARVALIASGGLTHFVIDESVDRFIIDALTTNHIERLTQLDEMTWQAGTSETKNWIPVAGAMGELGMKMTMVDYVPCYRSPAGTGNAMGFAYWR